MLTTSGESLRIYSWWLSDTPSTDWPDLPGTCVLGRHSDLSPIRIAPSEIGHRYAARQLALALPLWPAYAARRAASAGADSDVRSLTRCARSAGTSRNPPPH